MGSSRPGKGTQSELLAKDFQLAHLSAGDLLRAEVQSGSEVGRMAAAVMKDGKIVPMDVILSLLQKAIVETPSHYRGILIDGFPRALDQAKRFEETIARASLVINFTVPLPVLEQRLLDRGKTSGRVDDNLESIRKRFSTHVQESGPVLEYFGDRVLNVDGSASVEEVYDVLRTKTL
ncbi:adenylate kinase [Chytriomyces cf. hyalinus JEL632]|nr:adenylate kinase [Chytriomyces cf. hyalinus JEL632]